MSDKLEFRGLNGVLAHFEKSGQDAQTAIKVYRSQVKELTGHDPSAPITPLDVVKIVQRVFFGGAHDTDTARGLSGDSRPDDGNDASSPGDLAPPADGATEDRDGVSGGEGPGADVAVDNGESAPQTQGA